MVKSSTQWSTWDRCLVCGMFGVWYLAMKNDFGLPVALLMLCIAPFVFGRKKWEGEVSAYSVCNKDGRRIAGTFTAEQFDAQLRGGPRPDDNPTAASTMHVPTEAPAAPEPVDPAVRRRRAAEAAERRATAAASSS